MKTKTSTIITIILIVLAALFLVLQGAPYFQGADGRVSVASYIWLPGAHADVTENIAAGVEGYTINDIVGGTVLMEICAVAAIILLGRFGTNIGVMAATAIWGIYGIIVYAGSPALRLGGTTQIMILVLCAAITLVSALALAIKTGLVKERHGEQLTSDENSEYVLNH